LPSAAGSCRLLWMDPGNAPAREASIWRDAMQQCKMGIMVPQSGTDRWMHMPRPPSAACIVLGLLLVWRAGASNLTDGSGRLDCGNVASACCHQSLFHDPPAASSRSASTPSSTLTGRQWRGCCLCQVHQAEAISAGLVCAWNACLRLLQGGASANFACHASTLWDVLLQSLKRANKRTQAACTW